MLSKDGAVVWGAPLAPREYKTLGSTLGPDVQKIFSFFKVEIKLTIAPACQFSKIIFHSGKSDRLH